MENYKISQELKNLVQLQSESEEYFDSIFNKSLGFEEVFDKTKDQKDKTFDAQGCFENNLQTTVQENNVEFTNHISEMINNSVLDCVPVDKTFWEARKCHR